MGIRTDCNEHNNLYDDNLSVEILPAYCNWTHIDGMKYDTKEKLC